MHELSIATSVIESATARVREVGGGRVTAVTLRIGPLAGVHTEALQFSFELAREGTVLESAELRIVSTPVVIWCPVCRREAALPGIQPFACPACGTKSGDLRGGRELDLESIELATSGPENGTSEETRP
jgi:hydrogenase nickel incorporation protein HypA/HybF